MRELRGVRTLVHIFLVLTGVWLCELRIALSQQAPSRPNIVIILADDLGYNDVSFHGSKQIPTPNIDSLAKSGVILNNYYVNPICTPTRVSLMTGRYPIHDGMWFSVILGPEPYGLPLNETLMSDYLRKNGYATHIVGKWHLGFFRSEYTPTHRGFDSHFGYWCGHQDYYDHSSVEGVGYWGTDLHRNMSLADDLYNQYSTTLYTKEATRIIRQHNTEKPLFLYLAHLAVHSANSYTPLQAPRAYVEKMKHISDKNRRTFAGMMVGLDDSVGDVVQALQDRGMLNNTIIVFSTDNGGPAAGFDMNHASNWPLRGVKDTLWEGGVRGAGFVWSSLLPKPGRVSNQLMHVSDWLPSLYSAIGGDTKELGNIDGVDMWHALSSPDAPSPRNIILHNIDNIRHAAALRKGNYKLVVGHTYNGAWDGWYPPEGLDRDKPANAKLFHSKVDKVLKQMSGKMLKDVPVDCGGPKPANGTCSRPDLAPCLFDISKDPCEFHDLAAKLPNVFNDLMAELHRFNATVTPNGKRPVDPNGNPKHHGYAWVPWRDEEYDRAKT